MQLTITHFEGRRVSYEALVRVRIADERQSRHTAYVVDETGLWKATVHLDARLEHRMRDATTAYFWARIRGGEIDLKERELEPEWEGKDD